MTNYSLLLFRNSRSKMLLKIGVLKIFAVFTGKHVFESLFNRVKGLEARDFTIKRLQLNAFL